MKFAKFLGTSILKNICERLILFNLPQNIIADSSGLFGLDETLTDYKVSFIKQSNIIQSNAAISFICKLKKNVSLTFQLTFLLIFLDSKKLKIVCKKIIFFKHAFQSY